jgi:diguanylate cyclase (GGDEF)-like protein
VTTDDLPGRLVRSPLFRGVPMAFVTAMAARCDAVALASGETLLTAGSSNDRLYLVLSGSVRVRMARGDESNPTNVTLVSLGPGECVGELSILDGRPVSADVIAEESTVLTSFDHNQLWALIEASPVAARNLLQILGGRIRHDDAVLAEPGRLRYVEQAGMIDSLTGLRNRRWLEDAFSRQLERSARTAQPVSILLIEIDHFTELNKAHGTLVGDALLCRVAEVLLYGLRPQDMLTRYAGGEFAVLLPGLDASATIAVAERLRHAVESAPRDGEGAALPVVTISIGGTTRRPFEALQDLLQRAEGSLERAKQGGHNRTSD